MEKPVGVSEIRTRNFWAQNQALSPYDILGRRVRLGKPGQAKYRAHQMSTLDYSVRTYEKEQKFSAENLSSVDCLHSLKTGATGAL